MNILKLRQGELGGIVSTFISKVLLSLVTFLISIITSRMLGAESLGLYASVLSTALILCCIFTLGCDSALLYYSSRCDFDKKIGALIFLIILYSTILFVLLSIADMLWPSLFSGLRNLQTYMLMLASIYIVNSALFAICTGRGFLLKVNMCMLVSNLTLLVVLLILNNYFGMILAVEKVIVLYSSTISLSILYMLYCLRKNKGSFLSLIDVFNVIKYGKKSFLGSVSGVLRLRFPILLLTIMAQPNQVGIYSVVQMVLESLYIFPVILGSLMIPIVTKGSDTEAKKITEKYLLISSVFSVLSIVFLYAVKSSLVIMFYGDEFAEVSSVLGIILPSAFLFGINKIIQSYFYGINMPAIVSFSEALTLFFLIALTLVFVKPFGINGVAISVVISMVIQSIYLMFKFKIVRLKNVI